MEVNKIIHHRFSAEDIKISRKEIFRYLGYSNSQNGDKENHSTINEMIEKSISEIKKIMQPQSLYEIIKIDSTKSELNTGIIKFANTEIKSFDLGKNIKNCDYVIILASTIGSGIDLLIKKYSKIDSSFASILQATGSMFIESYVNELNFLLKEEIKKDGYILHPRFSSGYGDLSLTTQNIFFTLLPCCQKIGLTLMDTFTMAPEKSITAFIGLEKE